MRRIKAVSDHGATGEGHDQPQGIAERPDHRPAGPWLIEFDSAMTTAGPGAGFNPRL
ncbi:hypothetical protein ABFV52_25465 [Pseudomonas syringae]